MPLVEAGDGFCGEGCRSARALLQDAGLLRYYDLRGPSGTPSRRVSEADEAWLETAAAGLSAQGGMTSVTLDIEGLHCAACVWLCEQVFARHQGGLEIEVNPGLGKARLSVDAHRFSLPAFVREMATLGYRFGPATRKAESDRLKGLLLRIGVCAALAMNAMLFSFAIYAGLDEGPLHTLMLRLSWVVALLSVIVGGPVFFRGAYESLKRGVLHLDLPIALGIALAFGGSTYSFFMQNGRASYFDTVATFVTLMLFGRYLHERVLERNRKAILEDDGVAGLYCHVIEGGRVVTTRVGSLREGSRLFLRPGDLVPVDARLDDEATQISRAWITGEANEASVVQGEVMPAGSFHAGRKAVSATAQAAVAGSRLEELLRSPKKLEGDVAKATPFWAILARYYVAATLLVAGATLGGWALYGDIGRGVESVVAVLVVACPCAFGIAVPVAYEVAQARLRREGVFVRSSSLLDRAVSVRKLMFDKTGTLTLGRLTVEEPAALRALGAGERRVLFNLAVRSNHPKSRAIVEALGEGNLLDEAMVCEEVPGKGMRAEIDGVEARLGAPGWAGEAGGEGDTQLSIGGERVLAIATREAARPEAPREIAELARRGYEVHLVSGDAKSRADELASALAIDGARVVGAASPEQKEEYVRGLDRGDTLMVGDGVNDAAAMRAAHCSVTPAGDMPFLPARTDAYVQGPLVRGVRVMLETSRKLDRVVSEAVSAGVAYNVLAVLAASLGQMSPLLAAVLMPTSSIGVVLWVAYRLERGKGGAVGEARPLSPIAA